MVAAISERIINLVGLRGKWLRMT
jgi:hypothetical protein